MPRKTLIQQRRDTKSNWVKVAPVLADGELGVELDTNRTKLGDGSTSWSDLPYQNVPFYGAWEDSTTQTISSTTTAYPIKLNTEDFSNGVSVVSDGTNLTRIKFDHAGVYNIQWSGQFKNTNNADQDASVWLRINEVDVPGSAGLISIPSSKGGAPGHLIVGWNYFLKFNDGDYLQLMWSATSTAVSIPYLPVGTLPTRPSTASVVLTVSQVA